MAPGDGDGDGGEEREEQGDAGTDYRSCVDSGDEEEDKVSVAPCSLLATLLPPAAGGGGGEGAGVPPRARHVGGRQGGQGAACRGGGGRHQLGLGGEAMQHGDRWLTRPSHF